MSNRLGTTGRQRRALPSLVLVAMIAAALVVSVAQAEDPPIVSVGAGGNTASGSVGSGGQTGACVNDQSSTVDPSAEDTNGAARVNSGTCTSANGASTSTGSTGSTGSNAGSASAKSSAEASWVSSSQAVGLRIVRVQHVTAEVTFTKRFRVLVTLRDLRGRYVRNAIVTVGRVPAAANTIAGTHSTFSNKAGRASIAVPVTKCMLGTRRFLKITARTPKSRSMTLRSVRLPAVG